MNEEKSAMHDSMCNQVIRLQKECKGLKMDLPRMKYQLDQCHEKSAELKEENHLLRQQLTEVKQESLEAQSGLFEEIKNYQERISILKAKQSDMKKENSCLKLLFKS